jgi:DNA-binding NarL/FixJ family response regulator
MPDSAVVQHVFISKRLTPLARWYQAFPAMQLLTLEALLKAPLKNPLFWLELAADDEVERVVSHLRAQVGAHVGAHPFIVLSSTPTDEQALQCFSLGARGYCNAHSAAGNLQAVADVVMQGGLWLGNSLLQRLIHATTRSDLQPVIMPAVAATSPVSTSLSVLTEREHAVAKAVASGASNKEIARLLGITERTVKAHVSAIFEKLGLRDRLQLALLVNRNAAA